MTPDNLAAPGLHCPSGQLHFSDKSAFRLISRGGNDRLPGKWFAGAALPNGRAALQFSNVKHFIAMKTLFTPLFTLLLCSLAAAGFAPRASAQCLTDARPDKLCPDDTEIAFDFSCGDVTEEEIGEIRLESGPVTLNPDEFSVDPGAGTINAVFTFESLHAGLTFDATITRTAGDLTLENAVSVLEAPEISGNNFVCAGATAGLMSLSGKCTRFGTPLENNVESVVLKKTGQPDVPVETPAVVLPGNDTQLTITNLQLPDDMQAGAWDVVVTMNDQEEVRGDSVLTVRDDPGFRALPGASPGAANLSICVGQENEVILTGYCAGFQDPDGESVVTEVFLSKDENIVNAESFQVDAPNIIAATFRPDEIIVQGAYQVFVEYESGVNLGSDNELELSGPGARAFAAPCPDEAFTLDIVAQCVSLGGEGLNNIASAVLTDGAERIEATNTSAGEFGLTGTARFEGLSAAQLAGDWTLELSLETGETIEAETFLTPACATGDDPCLDNPMTLTAETTAASDADGTITVDVVGGAAPYEYSLDEGATWQAENRFTGLEAGDYEIYVRDAEHCLEIQGVEVPRATGRAAKAALANTLRVYPNPASGAPRLAFDAAKDAAGSVAALDLAGRAVAKQLANWSAGPNEIAVEAAKDLAPGVYFLRVVAGEAAHTVKFTKY